MTAKLNLIAIDILTLYALIDSSFWFQTGPLYTSRGHRLFFPNKIAFLKKILKIVFVLANSLDPDEMPRFCGYLDLHCQSTHLGVTSIQRIIIKVCTEDWKKWESHSKKVGVPPICAYGISFPF